jgi:hypothetical protein
MSRINTVPRGLQSFLGNTNMGDNPTEMSPVAAPVVDLDGWLRIDKMRSYVSAGTVMLTIGDVVSLTVPDNKLYMVQQISFHAERSAGSGTGTVRLLAKVEDYPSYTGGGDPGGPIVLAYGEPDTFNTGSYGGLVEWLPQPFPVPAGAKITWTVSSMSDPTNDDFTVKAGMFYFELDT